MVLTKIRNILVSRSHRIPLPVARALSRIAFRISSRPHVASAPNPRRFGPVQILPFKNGAKGALCISADFELSWAWRFARRLPKVDMGKRERQNVPKLVRLFDDYSVPVTWATVGHLFLESCQRGPKGLPHPEMLRPAFFKNREWIFQQGDWYQHDPCTDYRKSPTWYAPDLINLILGSGTSHEIGTHTFSHIDFSDQNCPPELAEQEIQKCIEVMEPFGLRPRSVVFPGGTCGNFETLEKLGCVAVRSRQPDDEAELSYPQNLGNHLWNIPASLVVEKRRHWDNPYAVWRINRYIQTAIDQNSVCHLWFHPSLDPEVISEILPNVLDFAIRKRQEGSLWIATIGEIADYCQARTTTCVTIQERGSETCLTISPKQSIYPGEKSELTLSFEYPFSKSLSEIKKEDQQIPFSVRVGPKGEVNIVTFNIDPEESVVKPYFA
ncbi:MAG: polysaccharide deacetylase family protein [Candidatus Hodarchaeota archaeon]